MIHEAVRSLYSNVGTINGDTEDTITVLDTSQNLITIKWSDVETKASELAKLLTKEIETKNTNKNNGITKLKSLGLTDDEITALIGK
jgi:predicted P-loop ATPase|tara:strand:- start:39 stop:299 length:261 start_codon:yes stop_codon:yes gene_type:complete